MDTDKNAEMSKFLNHAYFDFQRKRGRYTSQNQFAKHLGVTPSSLNYWLQGLRLPTGENVYKLAKELGEEVYRILDIPYISSQNKYLVRINKNLPDLTEDEQERYADEIEKAARAVKERSRKPV